MNSPSAFPTHGLYLITPDEPSTGALVDRVSPLLAHGVALLQLRNKAAGPRLLRDQALALLPLCQAADVPLIINDDWRLAAEVWAAGAHLGAADGDLEEARAAVGASLILGVSCYGDLERAQRARDAGANYLAFGACFPSTTKPTAPSIALSLLGQARGLGLPVVAIGGLSPDNAALVTAAGADLLAVIGAVFDAPDPIACLRAFHAAISSIE